MQVLQHFTSDAYLIFQSSRHFPRGKTTCHYKGVCTAIQTCRRQKVINNSERWRCTLARWVASRIHFKKKRSRPPIAFYSVNLCLKEGRWHGRKWLINDPRSVRRSAIHFGTIGKSASATTGLDPISSPWRGYWCIVFFNTPSSHPHT